MTAPVAPTLAAILLAGHDLAVVCDPCRLLVPLDVRSLALAKDENRPITAFRFRCKRCGAVSQPRVTAPGNCTMGFPQIWPPASAE